MLKIAISGKARSGKDTVADLILQSYFEKHEQQTLNEFAAAKFAFANPIKKIILQMFPQTSKEVLWGPSENRSKLIPETNITYRQLLLDIGKFGRNYNSNLWINSTFESIQEWSVNRKNSLIIISDLRFKEEFYHLKTQNYYLIRVIRPNNTYLTEQPVASIDISETNLDDLPNSEFNYVIVNDSDLNSLKLKTEMIPIL